MRYPALVVAVLFLATGLAAAQECDPSLVEGVSVDGSRTGWGDLFLGMTRATVEARVGQELSLKVYRPEFEEPPSVEVEYDGAQLTLLFRTAEPDAVLDYIVVNFGPGAKACDRDTLAHVLRLAVPDLTYNPVFKTTIESEDDTPAYIRAAYPTVALLLKPRAGMLVIRHRGATH